MPEQILQDSVGGETAWLAAKAAAPHNENINPSAVVGNNAPTIDLHFLAWNGQAKP